MEKSKECCPDVCALIKKMKTTDENKLKDVELYRNKIKAELEKMGIKTYTAERIQRQEDFFKNRINELSDLEKILEINNICRCV